jgi:hypothetical protein
MKWMWIIDAMECLEARLYRWYDDGGCFSCLKYFFFSFRLMMIETKESGERTQARHLVWFIALMRNSIKILTIVNLSLSPPSPSNSIATILHGLWDSFEATKESGWDTVSKPAWGKCARNKENWIWCCKSFLLLRIAKKMKKKLFSSPLCKNVWVRGRGNIWVDSEREMSWIVSMEIYTF